MTTAPTNSPQSPLNDSQSPAAQLRDQLANRTATIGVVGLGYVGLPLVKALHEVGFPIVGFDVDQTKIDKLNRGEAYIHHIGSDLFTMLAESDRFSATANGADLAAADVILLCVPTPLGKHREPDLSAVLRSTEMVAAILRAGQLVILESTTYPGTTRGEMQPILDHAGLTCGRDYFLAYSPEREDPGRAGESTRTIPKLVGGIDPLSGELAELFYSAFVDDVHAVSSAEVAESAKLLENIYRAVNIAMVNELKMLLTEMNIDVWEVIAAASTKPFGFQPFYPGPGLGGHCIPIDPFYLTWKAREIGRDTRFIELAGEVNSGMPRYVIARIAEALNDDGKALRNAKILILGIAYKPNVDDIRESPAAEIIELLGDAGASVSYHDPHMPHFPGMRKYNINLHSQPLDEQTLTGVDAVVIVTNHDAIDYEAVGRHARVVIDTRNAMATVEAPAARIIKA